MPDTPAVADCKVQGNWCSPCPCSEPAHRFDNIDTAYCWRRRGELVHTHPKFLFRASDTCSSAGKTVLSLAARQVLWIGRLHHSWNQEGKESFLSLGMTVLHFPALQLTAEHLSNCTALRYLDSDRLYMSEAQACLAWQHLEWLDATVEEGSSPQELDKEALGFISALGQLPSLRELTLQLRHENQAAQLSRMLRDSLRGCSVLEKLHLEGYVEPALMSAPLPALTSLYVGSTTFETVPPAAFVPRLQVRNKPLEELLAGQAVLGLHYCSTDTKQELLQALVMRVT